MSGSFFNEAAGGTNEIQGHENSSISQCIGIARRGCGNCDRSPGSHPNRGFHHVRCVGNDGCASYDAEHTRINRRDPAWVCYDRSTGRHCGRTALFTRFACLACFTLFRPLINDATSDFVVDFSAAVQSLGALQAAAYRLIGTATCQIDRTADRWVCKLMPISGSRKDTEAIKIQFLDMVTDENLRERIAQQTEGVRNVILSLAFGSLASSSNDQ